LIAAQPGIAADRFAREIIAILTDCAVRLRQLNGIPFGHLSYLFHATIHRQSFSTTDKRAVLSIPVKPHHPLQIQTQQSWRIVLLRFMPGCLLLLVAFVSFGHVLHRRRLPSTPADAALVFGTGLHWKAHARISTAAQLFHQGRVRALIVSGGVLMPGTTLTEATWFRDALLSRGVPSECILMEARATNTAENATYTLPIIQAQHFQSVILIMSDYEGLRAHLTAKRAWEGQSLTIYDLHAPSVGHWNAWTWWLSREGWSLTWDTVSRLIRYRLWAYM
jgi:uncharacterized SAM-binding protein YcdF (DUF218 family)